MVGFNPRRRFAPERSPSQEQRLLRFSSGPNIPQQQAEAPVGSEHFLTPDLVSRVTDGGRGNMRRLMSAGHGPAEGGHGGDHGDHGEHGEHAHSAREVLEHMGHLEHELHDLLHKFDDTKLQEHLQSGEYSIWTTERGFVSSTMSMLGDAKQEIEKLAEWEEGKMSPDAFMAWLAASEVQLPLSKEEQINAENHSFEADNARAEAEIASLEALRPTDGSAFEDRRIERRIKAIRDERRKAQIKHERILKRIQSEKELLVEERFAGRPSNADADVFYELRGDALADLRSMSQNLDVKNESDRITFNQLALGIPSVVAFVNQKKLRADAAIKATERALEAASETNMHGRGTKAVIAEVEARAGGGGDGKKEQQYDPHIALSGSSHSLVSQFKHAIGSVGLKFYSVKGVMEGFHLWYEAWKGALHKYHHREGSMFADFLGKTTRAIPGFGEEVFTELEANDDKANDEVKNTYKEILEKRNVNFKALVDGPGSELSRNIADYNRTRAILEYAASRGWLYDLDQGSKEHFFGRHIHELVPHEWDHNRVENYVSTLITQQNQGKKAEQEKYHQRYFNVNSTDVFVKLMEEELNTVNMWGAMGILQRSLERGLWGEVSPWHAVALIRQMEKSELFRRYVTVDFIDQFGNKSLYNSFGRWSGNVTKLTRKQWFKAIQESLRTGKKFELKNVVDADSGKTMQGVDVFLRAQQELEALYGPYDDLSEAKKKEFDRSMAQFLSGSIVEKNGKHASIFTGKFEDWTNKDVGQGQIKINDEDEDYYRNGTFHNPSETTTLADTTVFEQIFAATGNGQFENETRARFAADSIVTMIEDLTKKGMTAERDWYIKITRRKMTQWYQKYVSDARASAVAFQKMLRPHENPGERTPFVVLEFVRLGLISLDTVASGLQLQGRLLSVNVLAECSVFRSKLPPAMQAQLTAILGRLDEKERKEIRGAEAAVRAAEAGEAPAPAQERHP